MKDVFIACADPDAPRAGRLIRALERAGFSVWTHADLPGGENWRAQVEAALESATSVVVLWTKHSVGPGGEFVRDEARWARERGRLVPVFFENVDPPLGFGELQSVDLTRWGGSHRNPSFKDLCAAIRARAEGIAVPPARGPRKRVMRRITYGAFASMAGAGLVFAFNLFAAQRQVCGMPFAQPLVSDACGALGFGERPTKAERLAWESRESGSCEALRDHMAAFPKGAFRGEAAGLIAARQVEVTEAWVPAERRLVLYVAQTGPPALEESAAREAALDRGGREAERLCRGFTATTLFRPLSSSVEARSWQCASSGGGVTCGFEGDAVCRLQEKRVLETETCQ